ncbi:MAG: hypothetical protein IJH91_10135, partial [Mogibacterium sp.]|nr:hypothetical protein [Mogibacterium sp.]
MNTQSIRKRSTFVVILALLIVLFSSAVVSAVDAKVTIEDYNYPTTLVAGYGMNIKGTITSNQKITRVEIGVVDKSTKKWTAEKYDNKNVDAKTFNVAKADSSIVFGNLPKGKYSYRIYVHTASGAQLVLDKEFTIEAVSIKLSDGNYPTTLDKGKGFSIKGKITSNAKLKRIEIGIVDASTKKWTAYKYDNKNVNAKTFDVSKADAKLLFGKLDPGTYYYRIYAHTTSGDTKTVLNKKFTVKDPSSASASAADTAEITLSGENYPTTIKEGGGITVKGTIKSSQTITRVKIGIVDDTTGNW